MERTFYLRAHEAMAGLREAADGTPASMVDALRAEGWDEGAYQTSVGVIRSALAPRPILEGRGIRSRALAPCRRRVPIGRMARASTDRIAGVQSPGAGSCPAARSVA